MDENHIREDDWAHYQALDFSQMQAAWNKWYASRQYETDGTARRPAELNDADRRDPWAHVPWHL